ncbi:MAG TPA: hypothetical protein VGM26_02090 [Rhizomicrobium sp.]|jgi:hypothetical protein
MSQSILFTTWLHDLMTARKISADHLQHELNYRTSMRVRSWLDGHSRPDLLQLPALAKVLKADPVEMIAGWILDQMPEMEETLWAEMLQPRGSTFPRSDDLALRAPKPRKRVPLW